MRYLIIAGLLCALAVAVAAQTQAPTGFDDKSNGMVDDTTHQADQAKFDEVEGVDDGLGPLYNDQSCRECHQNLVSGGASQVTELRVGHLDGGRFRNPEIPIARGTVIITGRSLVNDRAIWSQRTVPGHRNPRTRAREGTHSHNPDFAHYSG